MKARTQRKCGCQGKPNVGSGIVWPGNRPSRYTSRHKPPTLYPTQRGACHLKVKAAPDDTVPEKNKPLQPRGVKA